jgi:hypothetical protein
VESPRSFDERISARAPRRSRWRWRGHQATPTSGARDEEGATRTILLTIDAVINLALGALLLVFPRPVISFLGLPPARLAFYPSILGAVLFGIGIALIVERNNQGHAGRGLGLIGAVAINLCGGIALVAWLLFGGLGLPVRGAAVLWVLAVLLVGLSCIELVGELRERRRDRAVPTHS